jgi:hypothetical protein
MIEPTGRADGALIRRQVHRTQFRLADLGVALVDRVSTAAGAELRAAVSDVVLGSGQD